MSVQLPHVVPLRPREEFGHPREYIELFHFYPSRINMHRRPGACLRFAHQKERCFPTSVLRMSGPGVFPTSVNQDVSRGFQHSLPGSQCFRYSLPGSQRFPTPVIVCTQHFPTSVLRMSGPGVFPTSVLRMSAEVSNVYPQDPNAFQHSSSGCLASVP